MANANHSNGRLFRILTESPKPIEKQYSVGLRMGCGKGERPTAITKNAASPINRDAAAVFPQQKTTGSVLADPRVFTSFKQFF